MKMLGLDARRVIVLRMIASDEGCSQQSLGRRMQLPPPRIVTLVDALEQQGLVERRQRPTDRRVRALHLTAMGKRTLDKVMKVGAAHEDDLCSPLTAEEREQLVDLLTRIADAQGLPRDVAV
jgi:DNA-binding MarR family transcriptional regulator